MGFNFVFSKTVFYEIYFGRKYDIFVFELL